MKTTATKQDTWHDLETAGELSAAYKGIPWNLSGAYVLRRKGERRALYVGMSDGGAGGLRKRMLRHTQSSTLETFTLQAHRISRSQVQFLYTYAPKAVTRYLEKRYIEEHRPQYNNDNLSFEYKRAAVNAKRKWVKK